MEFFDKFQAKGKKVTHSTYVISDYDIFPSAQTTKIKRMLLKLEHAC